MGHEVVPYFLNRNIYLDKARNLCVKKFLETDCSDLIFIDSDVGFDDDAIEKLLVYDRDIIAGIYPLKVDFLEFPMLLEFDKITNNCKEESTGLVTAKMAPTGFMRINRRVFDRLIEHDNPENSYRVRKDSEGVYTFFNTGILFDNDDTWYGEDVAFCKHWKSMGGKIFIQPDINFTHTGTKNFTGNLHEYLMGRKVETIKGTIDTMYSTKTWSSGKEIEQLKRLARISESIVEVGCWKGATTKEFLTACKGTVYAVDHWKGSSNDVTSLIAVEEDVYNEFINNVGNYQNLKVLKGNSVDMAESFNGNKVDMVYIDADHSYESCKADIEAWLPKCRKIICGHDYSDGFPGVIQAVTEKFGQVNTADTLWWKEL